MWWNETKLTKLILITEWSNITFDPFPSFVLLIQQYPQNAFNWFVLETTSQSPHHTSYSAISSFSWWCELIHCRSLIIQWRHVSLWHDYYYGLSSCGKATNTTVSNAKQLIVVYYFNDLFLWININWSHLHSQFYYFILPSTVIMDFCYSLQEADKKKKKGFLD